MSAQATTACADCGESMPHQTYTGMLEFLNHVIALCDDCAAKRTTAIEMENIRQDCKRRYFAGVQAGLLTEAFRAASFSTSNREIEARNAEAWEQAREWKPIENIYIYGGVGCGKTHMALCMMRRQFVAGLNVAQVTAREFAKAADMFRDPRDMMRLWKAADLLLLDDIDKTTWTLERIDALWELLNWRASTNKRTIITANMDPHQLALLLRKSTAGQQGETNTARADAALERLKPVAIIRMAGKSLR